MHKLLHSKLGLEVSLGVIAAVIVLAVTLSLVATSLIHNLGSMAVGRAENAITEQAYDLFQRITQEKAERYNAVFDKALAQTKDIAAQSRELLALENPIRHRWAENEELTYYPHNGYHGNSAEEESTSNYCCENSIAPFVQKDMDALSNIAPLLKSIHGSSPNYIAAWSARHYWTNKNRGLNKAFIRYYPNRHYVEELPHYSVIYAEEMPYIQKGLPENNPEGLPHWSVSADEAGQGIVISVIQPVYSITNQYIGFSGIDINFDSLLHPSAENTFQSETPVNANREFQILFDRNGNIVSIPISRLATIGLSSSAMGDGQNRRLAENEPAQFHPSAGPKTRHCR